MKLWREGKGLMMKKLERGPRGIEVRNLQIIRERYDLSKSFDCELVSSIGQETSQQKCKHTCKFITERKPIFLSVRTGKVMSL